MNHCKVCDKYGEPLVISLILQKNCHSSEDLTWAGPLLLSLKSCALSSYALECHRMSFCRYGICISCPIVSKPWQYRKGCFVRKFSEQDKLHPSKAQIPIFFCKTVYLFCRSSQFIRIDGHLFDKWKWFLRHYLTIF